MPYVITFLDDYLDIDGVPLSCPAWELLNIETLMSGPDVRGEVRTMPGAVGGRPNILRAGAYALSLELFVWGGQDPEGAPYANPHEGVITNCDLLRSSVTNPTMVGRGTRLATWHRPGVLADLSATVQVRKLEVGSPHNNGAVPATIDLTVVTGLWSP